MGLSFASPLSSKIALDIGGLLYLHPSDSSAWTIVSIKLKGTGNYVVWSSAMKLALEAKNKYGFIDGKCENSKDDDVLANQWDRCNSVVLTWLLNSISEELFLGQVFSKLASEVWTDLKELTTMWKQFDAMLHLPSCSCQAAKDYNDFATLIKLMQFLMGLDDVYQPITKLLSLVGEKNGTDLQNSNLGDSGASQHMINNDKEMFNIVDASEFDLKVGHPNGTSVKDSKSRKVMVIGSQDSGLYFVGSNGNSVNVCFNRFVKSNLWHSRLGHPSDQVLAVLKENLDVKNVEHGPCEICHRAKQNHQVILDNVAKANMIKALIYRKYQRRIHHALIILHLPHYP
ncbi:uncharacterized protein LOC110900632 [Helianthus annuus]|uniref:uncharacterized protein LOC110900632 n=1 Tax=Helianthus annuus TaxID=4232 RepID=UPI001652F3AF|nr:uncharacterized protein LOC110900632 [Helianthus annuus]